MAERIAKVGVVVDGSTITAFVTDVDLSITQEVLDKTAMDDEARDRMPGLTDYSASLTLNDNFSTDTVDIDSLFFGLIGNTGFTCSFRARSSEARSSANPEFSGTFILGDGAGFGGSVGDVMQKSIELLGTGGAQISRLTSST